MSDLRLIPLGGLGEFGLNAMVLEWEDHLLLVDAGVMFPGHDTPGVDSIVPDFQYLAERRAAPSCPRGEMSKTPDADASRQQICTPCFEGSEEPSSGECMQ